MWRDRDREEAKAVLNRRASEIASLSWEELDRYGTQMGRLQLSSGRELEVETSAFWDMDDWASDMCVSLTGQSQGRWRTRKYKGWALKFVDDPDDPLGDGRLAVR